jgi:hypothetical protein
VKIIRMTENDKYFVVNSSNNLLAIDGITFNNSFKELILLLYRTKGIVTTTWPDKIEREYVVEFEYKTIQDLVEAYPEYLI